MCTLDYMVDLSSTIYMIGNAFGAIIITPLSDRFGRKWVLLITLWLQGIIGVCVVFSGSIAVFSTLRFFVGFLNMVSFVSFNSISDMIFLIYML